MIKGVKMPPVLLIYLIRKMNKTIIKVLEQMIADNWIIVNKHIRLEAISETIINCVHQFELDEIENKERLQTLNYMKKYFPEQFTNLLNKKNV